MINNLMSPNRCDAIEKANVAMLQLEITGTEPLVELTNKLNTLCQKVEEQKTSLIVLRIISGTVKAIPWPGQVSIQEINRWERALRRLERAQAAVIAVVDNMASGSAFELLLVCDYRIASPNFRLELPVNNGQIWPSMAIHRLVNQVGVARSRRLIMSHTDIGVQRALDMGLIDDIHENTESALQIVISRLNANAGAEIAIRRQLILETASTTFEDAVGTYLASCDRELRRLHTQRDAKNA